MPIPREIELASSFRPLSLRRLATTRRSELGASSLTELVAGSDFMSGGLVAMSIGATEVGTANQGSPVVVQWWLPGRNCCNGGAVARRRRRQQEFDEGWRQRWSRFCYAMEVLRKQDGWSAPPFSGIPVTTVVVLCSCRNVVWQLAGGWIPSRRKRRYGSETTA